jgi:hypothetical protein
MHSEMRSTDLAGDGNPQQVDLFDQASPAAATALRESVEETEDAIQRATEHAKEQWLAAALDAVRRVAGAKSHFTAADVWDELARRGVAAPAEPRALAGVLRRARKQEIAEPTDRYVTGKSKDRHSSSLRVWRSEVFAT